jgi:hypothetical protein
MARRRDALDIELAAFEQRLDGIPHVATADASTAVLSDISGTTVSEHKLRRVRLALLLGLPLGPRVVAGDRADWRGFGPAINRHLKPHLVHSTFDSCLADVIEGHSGQGATRRHCVLCRVGY